VAGAAGDLGGRDAGVEPQGHRGVPQVVGAAAQRGCPLGRSQGGGAGALPDLAVPSVVERGAAGGAEQAPVGGGAVAGEVRAEQGDQGGRDGDGAGLARPAGA